MSRTPAARRRPDKQDVTKLVVEQTAANFDEDKVVVEAQWQNQLRFPVRSQLDIHVDVGPNRARRVVDRLLRSA